MIFPKQTTRIGTPADTVKSRYNKLNIRLFLACLLLTAAANILAASDNNREITRLRTTIKNRAAFGAEKTDNLIKLVEKASADNLPIDFMIDRINEGITKRAKYSALYKVVKKYSNCLSDAREILNNSKEELTEEQKTNYTQDLAELLNRKLKTKEWNLLKESLVKRGFITKHVLENARLMVRFMESKIARPYAMDIILNGIRKGYKFKETERIGQLYIDALNSYLTQEEVRDIVVEGIGKGTGLYQLKDSLAEMNRILARERKSILPRGAMEQVREELIDNKKFLERKPPIEKYKNR